MTDSDPRNIIRTPVTTEGPSLMVETPRRNAIAICIGPDHATALAELVNAGAENLASAALLRPKSAAFTLGPPRPAFHEPKPAQTESRRLEALIRDLEGQINAALSDWCNRPENRVDAGGIFSRKAPKADVTVWYGDGTGNPQVAVSFDRDLERE